jgi:hypothetical protein
MNTTLTHLNPMVKTVHNGSIHINDVTSLLGGSVHYAVTDDGQRHQISFDEWKRISFNYDDIMAQALADDAAYQDYQETVDDASIYGQ